MSLMSKVTAVVCNPVNCFPDRAELFFFYIVEVVLYVFSVILVAVWMKYGNFIITAFWDLKVYYLWTDEDDKWYQ